MKNLFRKIRHKIVAGKFVLPKDVTVLDTSCQGGELLAVLAKHNPDSKFTFCGVDISPEEIENARRNIPEGDFRVANNNSLPFPDKAFDVVISSLTLHHLHNSRESLREMKRVLKDKGVIYLLDVVGDNPILRLILRNIKCPEPYHFEKFYTLEDVENLVKDVGLKIRKKSRVTIFPTPSVITPATFFELVEK